MPRPGCDRWCTADGRYVVLVLCYCLGRPTMSWTPTLADFVVLLAAIGAHLGLVIMRPQMPSPRQSSWLRLKALGTLLAVVVLGGLWLLGRLVGSVVKSIDWP